MTTNVLGRFLDSLGRRKTLVLRMHSRARAILKNAKRRFLRRKSLSFLQTLIKRGDLVFDIGANVGDMTALYLELGARVVSVEPQEECLRILNGRFRFDPRVTIVPLGVGDREGEQEIMLSDIRSPISSMSEQWIAAVKSSGRFPHYEWSRSVTVPITTLDALIARYGEPDFCKVDVEGFEEKVLRGLSLPLACLSFEFHAELLPGAIACVNLLQGLGEYLYNYTIENRMVLESPLWIEHDRICAELKALPYASLQGDVYAFRHRLA